MRRITLASVTRPALPYFTALTHKREDFRGVAGGGQKFIEHKMFVLIFSTNFV
jgi:hypothetical protein